MRLQEQCSLQSNIVDTGYDEINDVNLSEERLERS